MSDAHQGITCTTQHIRSNSMICQHQPPCPTANAIDHDAARVVAAFPEQGWSLLCNGVIVFDDTGELLPDGKIIEPHRGPARHAVVAVP